jgi:hypothetical protein
VGTLAVRPKASRPAGRRNERERHERDPRPRVRAEP